MGTPAATAVIDEFDPVTDEMKRWEQLPRATYESFFAADGLLNEFAMLWALRERFPLHFTLFKQTACHLPHEANCEQLFSTAGNLSDPKQHETFERLLDQLFARGAVVYRGYVDDPRNTDNAWMETQVRSRARLP